MAIPKYALLSVASVPGDSPTNEKTSRNLRIGLSHERERFNYKPLVLRTFSLSSLLVLTLALIGLLEYAAIELPHSGYHTDRKREVRSPANFDRRQDSALSNLTTSSLPADAALSSVVATDYLNTDYTQTSSSSTSSTDLLASSAATTDYLNTDYTQTSSSSTSSTDLLASSATTTDYLNTVYTQTTSPTSSLTVDVPSLPPAAYVNTDYTQAIPATSSSTVVLTSATVTATYVNTNVAQTIPPSSTSILAPVSSTAAAEATPTTSPDRQPNMNSGVEVHRWSGKQAFVGSYLAVLVAVLYRMLWTLVCSSFALVEPFRQLAHAQGALAEHTLFHLYQSPTELRCLFQALAKQNWTFALILSTSLTMSLLPAMSSETLFVSTQWDCPSPTPLEPSARNPCPARMEVRLGPLRVLQVLLAFAASSLVFTISVLLATKTGLTTDPAAMATVASLMGHPDLARDLNQVPCDATTSEMQNRMRGNRYCLGFFESAPGQNSYGIRPMHERCVDTVYLDGHHAPVDDRPWAVQSSVSRTPLIRRWAFIDLVLAVILLGTFGVVLGYYLDGRNDGFNRFFSSDTFGPRFILASAGTAIATLWESAEQTQVALAPYARLAHRPSSPSTTLLFAPSNAPFVSTWQALRSRYFFIALLTITTLSAEALNIVVSGVPYASAQTWRQFLVSSYLSLAILGFMIIVLILMLFFARGHELRLPRRPDTLGGVMSYLSGSRTLHDFDRHEGETESDRRGRLKRLGKKYELRSGTRQDVTAGYVIIDAVPQQQG